VCGDGGGGAFSVVVRWGDGEEVKGRVSGGGGMDGLVWEKRGREEERKREGRRG
jgi:hypothetical protein